MSWFKIKKKERLRRCHVRISPKCKKIYKTKHKQSGKRTACGPCHKYLKKIGTNIGGFFKMQEPIEKFERINGEINFTKEHLIEIKNEEGKIIGTKLEKYSQKTNEKEIKEGIENLKEQIKNRKRELKKLKGQLDSLGKIPIKSNETIRLERNLIDLSKINKANELKTKIEPLEKQIELEEKIISKRVNFLKNG